MNRKQMPVGFDLQERAALEALADEMGLPLAATLRLLLRREAKEQGLWPGSEVGQEQEPREEVHHAQ